MHNNPHSFSPTQLEPFQQAMADILLGSPTAMKEFELIQQLQNPPYQLFSNTALRGDLQLFRTHFIVFHCLYKLQARWREEHAFELHIDPLHIELQEYQPGIVGLSKNDPLQSYYSDWKNMTGTTQSDVEDLLTSFWQGVGSGITFAKGDLERALQELELNRVPANSGKLRGHYRRLVHIHHPDKGGRLERMQKIQAAYSLLRNYLESSGR